MAEEGDSVHFLQDEVIEYEHESGFEYDELEIDDEPSEDEENLDENFEETIRLMKEHKSNLKEGSREKVKASVSKVTEWPEVIEDFVRNYLLRMGMLVTLDCFQAEWYRMKECGLLKESENQPLPDVYHQNRQLINQIQLLHEEVQKYKDAAGQAKDRFLRLKKERDYHRMHHRRVIQEKGKLMRDIQQLKDHCMKYENALSKIQQKYESTVREKMVVTVENNRLKQSSKRAHVVHKSGSHQATETSTSGSQPTDKKGDAQIKMADKDKSDSIQSKKVAVENKQPSVTEPPVVQGDKTKTDLSPGKTSKMSAFPAGLPNPYKTLVAPKCAHLTNEGGFTLKSSHTAHDYGISGLCLHPRKTAYVTASDDHTWRMWSLTRNEILMSGKGHKDWVGGVQIHPDGELLASCSGDGTAKLWNFREGRCVITYTDHQQPVWDCSWHSTGSFLATSSMDHTVKIWDIVSERCYLTLRGHADSVNSVNFLAYSNLLCTSSADKTVSLWDARNGLCVQTYYGHSHSCNSATSTLKNDLLVSADCFGHVYIWDINGNQSLYDNDFGPYSINKVSFDPCGEVVAMASSDGTIKVMNVITSQVDELKGHTDAVQDIAFAQNGSFLMSAGNDGVVVNWM